MAKVAKDKRQARREVVQQFERNFDRARFDYVTLIRPAQGKSKLVGVAISVALYAAVFAIAWSAWNSGRVSYELFVKTTWVLVLPATALGVFGWMLAFNRMENRVRTPLVVLIVEVEGTAGTLWRYAPILAAVDPKNTAAKTACNLSRELRVRDIDAEDYCNAVQVIHRALAQQDVKPLPTEVLQEVEANVAASAPE
jgi:hypothetical protein